MDHQRSEPEALLRRVVVRVEIPGERAIEIQVGVVLILQFVELPLVAGRFLQRRQGVEFLAGRLQHNHLADEVEFADRVFQGVLVGRRVCKQAGGQSRVSLPVETFGQ